MVHWTSGIQNLIKNIFISKNTEQRKVEKMTITKKFSVFVTKQILTVTMWICYAYCIIINVKTVLKEEKKKKQNSIL